MHAYVESAVVVGPGLAGPVWDCPALTGATPYDGSAPQPDLSVEILDPRERRRTSATVRLALAAADACVRASVHRADSLPCVFGSAFADGPLLGSLLTSLATPQARLSPTKFHNSVHNAALGYWTIATRCMRGSTSIAAGDWTAGATLLRAIVQASVENTTVLLVVYDAPFDVPLSSARYVGVAFAAALLIGPHRDHASCRLDVVLDDDAACSATPPHSESLHEVWRSNPAARILPLVERIARRTDGTVAIEHAAGSWLRVRVARC